MCLVHTYTHTYAHFSLFFLQIQGVLHKAPMGFAHIEGTSKSLYTSRGFTKLSRGDFARPLGVSYAHTYTHSYFGLFPSNIYVLH